MKTIVVIAVTLWALAGVARAGLICPHDDHGNDDPGATVRTLEQFAAGKGSADDIQFAELCLGGPSSHPFTARVVTACEKIVRKDTAHLETCMSLAARVGAGKLDGRDVFEWVVTLPRAPWDTDWIGPRSGLFLLEDLGDPRGAAVVIATWKEMIPKAAALERKHVGMDEWSGWRQHAAEILGSLGSGAEDAAFLDEQAKATVDPHVAEACRDAAAKIRGR
jgi:hypothetical protein